MPESGPAELTGREIELLGLAAAGLSNRAIARELGIAEQTVKNHMSNILRKLEVSDRTHAVVEAIRLGIVDLPESR